MILPFAPSTAPRSTGASRSNPVRAIRAFLLISLGLGFAVSVAQGLPRRIGDPVTGPSSIQVFEGLMHTTIGHSTLAQTGEYIDVRAVEMEAALKKLAAHHAVS